MAGDALSQIKRDTHLRWQRFSADDDLWSMRLKSGKDGQNCIILLALKNCDFYQNRSVVSFG